MIPDRYFEDLRRVSREHHGRTGRPLVTLSFAQSLDGSISLRRGEPLALSGPQSLAFTHRLRGAHDAILVGIGTVLADDPRLTARDTDGGNPRPVVLDSNVRIPNKARLWAHPCGPWVFARAGIPAEGRDAVAARGGRLFEAPRSHGGLLDLPAVLAELGRNEIRSLMVEGGAAVITSFLAAGLADRAAITIAPVFVGGLRALEAGPAKRSGLVDVEAYQVGADVVLTGIFEQG
jgi:3,4-dihydroxy 2-butanone 4-phosphate synthase/GTP cyclohydrolase II